MTQARITGLTRASLSSARGRRRRHARPTLPPKITLASRHARFGTAHDARGNGLVHLVQDVFIVWHRWEEPTLAANWACGSLYAGTDWVRLLLDAAPTCAPCRSIQLAEQLGAPQGLTRFVYYARRGDLIKIGSSRNVGERTHAQRAELLAVEPGDVMTERAIQHRFLAHQAEGEWFHPHPDLLSHIAMVRASAGAR